MSPIRLREKSCQRTNTIVAGVVLPLQVKANSFNSLRQIRTTLVFGRLFVLAYQLNEMHRWRVETSLGTRLTMVSG